MMMFLSFEEDPNMVYNWIETNGRQMSEYFITVKITTLKI